MQDPRIAELEFLSELDKNTSIFVDSFTPESQRYGLAANQFSDMIIHLLLESYINGPSNLTTIRMTDSITAHLEPQLLKDLWRFRGSQKMEARINHKGRLRLWTLRDELRAARRLDPLEVLYSGEYVERDWRLVVAFLGPGEPLSVLYCDIDDFKNVNDTLGHERGDQVLKLFMHEMKDVVGDLGDAYRKGGDEFVALLPKQSFDIAKGLAEQLRARAEDSFRKMPEIKDLPKKPTASIGVSCFRTKIEPAVGLDFVDKLMYRAKKDQGGNSICAEEFSVRQE